MRKLLFSSALVLATLQANAGQEDLQANVTGAPVVGGIFPHFGQAAISVGSKPVDQRMVAKTYLQFRDGNFALVDSTSYSYGNGRGGVPNPEDINNDEHILFDLGTTYTFNATVSAYENSKQRVQSFTDNKVKELIYKNWHTNTSSWKNAERYIYTYDKAGKMHSSLLQLWYGTLWSQDMNSVLNYDLNDNIVQMNSPTYAIDFVYDQAGNLVMITDKNLSQGTWNNNERKKYKYTGDDVSEYILEKWANGGWANTSKWEYVYDAQMDLVLTTEYTWGAGGWAPTSQEQYAYGPNSNLLKTIVQAWDAAAGAFANSKMEARAYNNNDLPEAITTYTWNGQNWAHSAGDIQVRYYYEVYFPTSVNTVATANTIKIFPVPATSMVNIAFQLDGAQDVAITLRDITGRLVYSEDVHTANNYSRAIPVGHLPTGHYALHISSRGLDIGRMVAVAH